MIRSSSLGTAPAPAGVTRVWPTFFNDRLLRNGSLLTLSSLATSVLGLAYWTLATHHYEPEAVGRNSAAISAMMFLAGVANLNLTSAMVRFLPAAGATTSKLIGRVYLAGVSTALILGGGFLLILPWVAPNLRFLTSSPTLAAWFAVATMAWTVFVLQDSALAGLRQTWLVPVENTVYAGAKLLLVVPLVAIVPRTGIYISWTVALVVSVIPVNLFLFKRAIPQHQNTSVAGLVPASGGTILRFAAADYGGALAWLAALNLVPLLVLQVAGPTSNGYFAVVWVISYTLYLVSANMGVSLVVETASAWSQLTDACRTVVFNTLKVVVPVVAVVVAAAPLILRLFGPEYSSHGSTALRLLALSAIPNVVTATGVSALRAQRRPGTGTAVLVGLTAVVFSLSAVLLPVMGITGVGTAWLIAQSAAAVVMLTVPTLWPRQPGRPAGLPSVERMISTLQRIRPRSVPTQAFVSQGRPARHPAEQLVEGAVVEALVRLASSSSVRIPAGTVGWDPVETQSDLLVAKFGEKGAAPQAVLKVATSDAAGMELRSAVRVISDLRADPRLVEWRRLLPEVLCSWSTPGGGCVVEKCIEGVDGRSVDWNDPCTAERGLVSAASAIGKLHHLTRRLVVVHTDWVTEWVGDPAETLATLYPKLDWRTASLRRIESEAADDLLGRRLSLGWAHSDYTPGNLILSPDADEVRGVVDWGGGSPNAPAFLDAVTLLISSRMLIQRRELGGVVVDLLRERRLTPAEESLLHTDDRLDIRTKLTICWLNHVAANLRKAAFYRTRLMWKRLNIDPVLRELSQC